MGAEIAVRTPLEPGHQDEGAFYAYVSKTFYQMSHLFRPMDDQVSIKVQDFGAGMFVIADTHLGGEMRAVGERNWSHIRSDNAKMFVLWIPLEGTLNMIHNGKREVLHPDEFMMTSSSLPHRGTVKLNRGENYRALMIAIPFSYVTDLMPYAQDVSGLKFAVDNVRLKTSIHVLKVLSENADDFDDETAQRFVAAALCSIFKSIRCNHEGAAGTLSIKESRAKEVLSFIDRHLAEPNLTAKKIGEGCSISSRYVHSLLRQKGTSLKDYVWRSRYDQARARIADPRYSHETIGSIAMDLGFRSNAHFSTGFRKVFGTSPSELRHCALEAVSKTGATEIERQSRPCPQTFRLGSQRHPL